MGTHRKIIVALAVILLLQAAANFIKYLFEIHASGYFGSDFLVFWTAARQALHWEPGAIYGGTDMLAPFAYPPHMMLVLWPFAFFSYTTAVAIWSIVPALLFYAMCRERHHRSNLQIPFWIVAAFMLPFLLPNIFTGQTGTLIAVLFLAGLYYRRGNAPLSGISFALMTVKPQFTLLLPFALAASRQWRILLWAGVVALLMLIAATLWLTPAIWPDYLRMMHLFGQYMLGGSERFHQLAVSPYVSLHGIGIPQVPAGIVQIIITAAMIPFVFWLFRRENGDEDLRCGLLACATLLATPYGLCYDTPILAVALIPLLARAWERGFETLGEIAAIFMLATMAYAQPAFHAWHIPFGLIALCVTFCVLLQRYRRG